MDFYIVLGVDRAATLNDIKRAYKRLARKCHPDINPGDRLAAQQFQQIAEAYETLSDPDRRRRYDTGGGAGTSAEPSTFGFEGFDFSISVSGASASTFGDLFADMFQPRDQQAGLGPQRGADLHQMLAVGFEAAMRGGDRQVSVTRQEPCRMCHGAGMLKTAEKSCPHCHGTGIVKSARGHMVFSKPCAHCGGVGTQAETRCPSCGGHQLETRTELLTLHVPPGLADGARIRVPGKGHAGRNGGEPGDLYVTLRVEPHPVFRRDGDDLHVVVPIAIHEAALGAKVDVPALEGTARLRVPPGTQSGQRFRLRERGAPSVRDGRRGDLVIEVRLVLPKLLDERSKELLREFGRINSEDVRRQGPKGHEGFKSYEVQREAE
jgi:molecular chaperone DnaJ